MSARRSPVAPRKQPSQQRSRVTVDAIVDATARVLVEDGYERASTNRIAQVAGVSVGSLYQYFPNKEALVEAVIARHCEELFALMSGKLGALAQAPLPVMAREMVQLVLEVHLHEPELHRVIAEQIPRLGAGTRLQEVNQAMTDMVVAYLQAHREEVAPANLELAAFFAVQLVEGVAHGALLEPHGQFPLDTLVDELTRMLLAYFTPVSGVLPLASAPAVRKVRAPARASSTSVGRVLRASAAHPRR